MPKRSRISLTKAGSPGNGSTAPVAKEGRLVYPSSDELKRITLVIPANLDLNVEIYARSTGELKMQVIAQALASFLQDKVGIPDPLQPPTATVWTKSAGAAAGVLQPPTAPPASGPNRLRSARRVSEELQPSVGG